MDFPHDCGLVKIDPQSGNSLRPVVSFIYEYANVWNFKSFGKDFIPVLENTDNAVKNLPFCSL